jgi:hypothetical protein
MSRRILKSLTVFIFLRRNRTRTIQKS